MNIILIYFLLLTFWFEKSLGFKLTQIKGLSLMNLIIYLCLFVWLFKGVSKRRFLQTNVLNKYMLLILSMRLFSILVKLVLGEIPNTTVLEEIISFKSWANPLLLFFVVFNILDDEKSCKKALIGLAFLLIISATTMLMVTTGLIELPTIWLKRSRSAGFGNPVDYASYLVLFIPLVFSYFFFSKSVVSKTTGAIVCIIAIFGLLATGSRGGAISFIFGMIAYVALVTRQKMMTRRKAAVVAVVVFGFALTCYTIAPSDTRNTVATRFDPGQSKNLTAYSSGRDILFRNAFIIFLDSPIFGHGSNTFLQLSKARFPIVGNTHNDYMLYLVEYGILGLVVYLMTYKKILTHILDSLRNTNDFRRKKLYASYLAGLCGLLLSMLSVNVIVTRLPFWIYTAIVMKFSYLDTTVTSNRIS